LHALPQPEQKTLHQGRCETVVKLSEPKERWPQQRLQTEAMNSELDQQYQDLPIEDYEDTIKNPDYENTKTMKTKKIDYEDYDKNKDYEIQLKTHQLRNLIKIGYLPLLGTNY